MFLPIALLYSLATFAADPPADVTRKQLKLGTVEFEVPANIKTFNIKGTAQTLNGFALVQKNNLKEVTVTIPVESLTTQMSLRDKHMREKIFQTKDGKLPAVTLKASNLACPLGPSPSTCTVQGSLQIQGIDKAFATSLQLIKTEKGYRAVGHGNVKLSDYGIPQPEQLGIKVANDVQLNLDVLVE